MESTSELGVEVGLRNQSLKTFSVCGEGIGICFVALVFRQRRHEDLGVIVEYYRNFQSIRVGVEVDFIFTDSTIIRTNQAILQQRL